jgi:hypothetical protein
VIPKPSASLYQPQALHRHLNCFQTLSRINEDSPNKCLNSRGHSPRRNDAFAKAAMRINEPLQAIDPSALVEVAIAPNRRSKIVSYLYPFKNQQPKVWLVGVRNSLLESPLSNHSFSTASCSIVSPSIAIFLLPSSILRSPIWITPLPAACRASQRRLGSEKMWESLRSRSWRLLSGRALRGFLWRDMLEASCFLKVV